MEGSRAGDHNGATGSLLLARLRALLPEFLKEKGSTSFPAENQKIPSNSQLPTKNMNKTRNKHSPNYFWLHFYKMPILRLYFQPFYGLFVDSIGLKENKRKKPHFKNSQLSFFMGFSGCFDLPSARYI
jgi:hypothetical protein